MTASITVLAEWKAAHASVKIERTVTYPDALFWTWNLWTAWFEAVIGRPEK